MAIFVKLCFGNFIGTEYMEREVNGVNEKGIFIPFRPNCIKDNKSFGPTLAMQLREKRTNFRGQTHSLVINVKDREYLEQLREMGYAKPLFYVGYGIFNRWETFRGGAKETTSIDEAFEKE